MFIDGMSADQLGEWLSIFHVEDELKRTLEVFKKYELDYICFEYNVQGIDLWKSVNWWGEKTTYDEDGNDTFIKYYSDDFEGIEEIAIDAIVDFKIERSGVEAQGSGNFTDWFCKSNLEFFNTVKSVTVERVR